MPGRLIPSALYHPGDLESALQIDCEIAQSQEDRHKLIWLKEKFGVEPTDYRQFANNLRTRDPRGVLSFILIQTLTLDDKDPLTPRRKEALTAIYRKYEALDPEFKASEEIAEVYTKNALQFAGKSQERAKKLIG